MSRVCADFLLRLSEFYVHAAELCCQICRRCQQLCELPSGEDPIVLECVSTCARCANSCKRVLATSTLP
jgi:polyferredoxin